MAKAIREMGAGGVALVATLFLLSSCATRPKDERTDTLITWGPAMHRTTSSLGGGTDSDLSVKVEAGDNVVWSFQAGHDAPTPEMQTTVDKPEEK